MLPAHLEYLIDALNALPTVGKKQATKIAYFLINQDDQFIESFIYRIQQALAKLHYCQYCQALSDDHTCKICRNIDRNNHQLCIVTNDEDLEKIEATHVFAGRYFVLHEEVDVKAKTKISSHTVRSLLNFIQSRPWQEIILATNWTVNGLATADFIKNIAQKIAPNALFYRLAMGLPSNSALDYADNETLTVALKNKVKF